MKSSIQSQSEVFRPRSVSLKASLMGNIVLKVHPQFLIWEGPYSYFFSSLLGLRIYKA